MNTRCNDTAASPPGTFLFFGLVATLLLVAMWMTVTRPVLDEPPAGSTGAAPATGVFAELSDRDLTVDLNSATATELQLLPGIGEVLAERIAAYRAANGPFDSFADLQAVHGIGRLTVAAIRGGAHIDNGADTDEARRAIARPPGLR